MLAKSLNTGGGVAGAGPTSGCAGCGCGLTSLPGLACAISVLSAAAGLIRLDLSNSTLIQPTMESVFSRVKIVAE